MDFRSVRETARKWEISERLVQRLCSEGRIAGAKKIGGSWAIPADSERPSNLRKRNAKALPADADTPFDETLIFSRLMPLMNTPFTPGKCKDVIDSFEDPGMRLIAQAEFRYFSGDADGAADITVKLLDHPDLAVKLSACLIYGYANLSLGKISSAGFAISELRSALKESQSISSAHNRAAMAFMGYTSSILLHLPLPDDVPMEDDLLSLLPPGLRIFALYVRSHQVYLEGDYARSLGIAEAALLIYHETYPIPEIYLRMVAVMDCMSLRRTEEAREHLLAAWELARPDGLIEAFGEHHGLLGGMLESTIKKDWPEDFKRIIDITYRFSDGWRRVHNPATEGVVTGSLTTTEFSVAMLAARGWTNQKIGKHLDISANTVKGFLAAAFRKLGISKRQELGKFMLR